MRRGDAWPLCRLREMPLAEGSSQRSARRRGGQRRAGWREVWQVGHSDGRGRAGGEGVGEGTH